MDRFSNVSALNDTGKGLLNGSKDGFVNVLGHSDNESDFKINVFIELNKLNLVLKSMEDVEPFIERIKNYEVDEN